MPARPSLSEPREREKHQIFQQSDTRHRLLPKPAGRAARLFTGTILHFCGLRWSDILGAIILGTIHGQSLRACQWVRPGRALAGRVAGGTGSPWPCAGGYRGDQPQPARPPAGGREIRAAPAVSGNPRLGCGGNRDRARGRLLPVPARGSGCCPYVPGLARWNADGGSPAGLARGAGAPGHLARRDRPAGNGSAADSVQAHPARGCDAALRGDRRLVRGRQVRPRPAGAQRARSGHRRGVDLRPAVRQDAGCNRRGDLLGAAQASAPHRARRRLRRRLCAR